MKLTGPQISAAMSLMGVTRESLSLETGVARGTIDNIVKENGSAREETIKKVSTYLESLGIEFLPGEGVRKKELTVTTYTGDTCLQDLLIDVHKTLEETGGELLIAHLDEGSATQSLTPDFLKDQIRKRKQANITMRMLVREDDENLIPPYDNYRAIPEENFSQYPFYIYGPKLALLSWKPSPRVVVHNDQRFAESARKLFDIAWNSGKPIERKQA